MKIHCTRSRSAAHRLRGREIHVGKAHVAGDPCQPLGRPERRFARAGAREVGAGVGTCCSTSSPWHANTRGAGSGKRMRRSKSTHDSAEGLRVWDRPCSVAGGVRPSPGQQQRPRRRGQGDEELFEPAGHRRGRREAASLGSSCLAAGARRHPKPRGGSRIVLQPRPQLNHWHGALRANGGGQRSAGIVLGSLAKCRAKEA